MIVRKGYLKSSKIMKTRAMNHPKITIKYNTELKEYYGDSKFLNSVLLFNTNTKQREIFECSGVFMGIGHEPNTECFLNTGLSLRDDGYIKTHNNVYTNIDGVFACGDVCDIEYKQAITASGFGCMAAIASEKYLSSR